MSSTNSGGGDNRCTSGRRRVVRALLVAATVAAVVACALAAAAACARGRPVELARPGGTFPVGRQITTAGPGLPVWLWYPASPSGAGRADYVPPSWSPAVPPLLGVGIVTQDLATVRGHSVDGAPLARGSFPVAVLVPGLGVEPWLYTGEAEDLASRGHVVALPVPRSTPVAVVDGHLVHAPDEAIADDAGNLADQVDRVDRTLAWLHHRSGRADDLVAAHVDPDTSIVVGHSFGGAVAVVACAQQPTCRGAVDLDGALSDVRATTLRAPILAIATPEGCHEGGVCDLPAAPVARPGAPAVARTALTVAGTAHLDFTDSPQLWIAPGLRGRARLGTLPGARVASIEAACVADFARAAIGEPAALDALGPCPGEPEVVAVRRR